MHPVHLLHEFAQDDVLKGGLRLAPFAGTSYGSAGSTARLVAGRS